MLNSFGSYLFFLAVGTLAAALGLYSVIQYSDPYTATTIVHVFFYGLLFLTIAGIASTSLVVLRYRYLKSVIKNSLGTSMRQGSLIALLFTASTFLQVHNLLVWWVGITLVLFIIVVESFFNTN